MSEGGYESKSVMMTKVGIFTVVMLLVSAALVIVFGDFRFGPQSTYHATFLDASRLKGGQKVRIAGVPVGAVKGSSSTPTTPLTSNSGSTSATSCTRRRGRSSATKTWSATGFGDHLRSG